MSRDEEDDREYGVLVNEEEQYNQCLLHPRRYTSARAHTYIFLFGSGYAGLGSQKLLESFR